MSSTADGIVFVTSGGKTAGLGHIQRCLSLAGQLAMRGFHSTFLVAGDEEALAPLASAGFRGRLIEVTDFTIVLREISRRRPQAIVLDSYEFRWDEFCCLLETSTMLVAIDDLADQPLPVDLVVNSSVGARHDWYHGTDRTRYLLGPDYVLLRPEFAGAVDRRTCVDVERVLVTIGGSDSQALTPRLIDWVVSTLPTATVDVVVGPFFGSLSAVRDAIPAAPHSVNLLHCPGNIRELMLRADIAVCAGGQTTFELAACGTPAIAVQVAVNQRTNLEGLRVAGTLLWAGEAGDPRLECHLKEALHTLASGVSERATMSASGRRVVDGQGSARVAQAMAGLVHA